MIIVIFNICIYCFRWKFFLAALRVPFANESAENKTLNIKVKKFIPVCHISNEMGYRWSNPCWGVAPPVRSPLAPENLHVWVGPHQCEHSEHPVQQQWKFLIGLTHSCLKYQLLSVGSGTTKFFCCGVSVYSPFMMSFASPCKNCKWGQKSLAIRHIWTP